LREPASRLLLTERVKTSVNLHVIAKGLTLTAGALGIAVPTDPAQFEFPIGTTRAHDLEAEGVMPSTGARYAVLNPGGGWQTKLWGAERFGALADELWIHHGLHSIITYGPGERELAEMAMRASRTGKAHTASLSLKGFYALARQADIYVGGDTGPTHLAVAAGAPVVGLFGPTEWWRNGSPRPEDICVERNDIDCRIDCNRRSCSQWVCMDISVERVLMAVSERLGRAKLVGQAETTTVA
jgi:ADP-heptose:LPS heptosyltransferase